MSLAELWLKRQKKVLSVHLAKGFSNELYICNYASVSQRALFVILEFGRVWVCGACLQLEQTASQLDEFWPINCSIFYFNFIFFWGGECRQLTLNQLLNYSTLLGGRALWSSVHKCFCHEASIFSCFISHIAKRVFISLFCSFLHLNIWPFLLKCVFIFNPSHHLGHQVF